MKARSSVFIAILVLLISLAVPGKVRADAVPIHIRDNDTGGDCSLIGIWIADSKTCQMTQDLFVQVVVDDNNITLDGNGYFISGTYWPRDGGSFTLGGVFVNTRNGVTIKNLLIRDFAWGMYVLDSNNIWIVNNTISGDNEGVFVYRSSHVTIENNHITNNTNGSGIQLQASNSMISHNTISNNTQHGILLSGNNNVISDNQLSNNYWSGIWVVNSIQNVIADNTMENNDHYGIWLHYQANANTIYGNTVSGNIFGMYLSDGSATNNTLNGNIIRNNAWGLFIEYANGNQIFNNDFVDNTSPVHSYGDTGNIYSLDKPVGGNYWSNFDSTEEGCFDVDADGFCDAGYIFDEGRDNLPWARQDGWLNQSPVADAGGPYTVGWGENLTLDGSGSIDPDNNIATYEWDLDNDGLYDDATGVTAAASFNQIGEHIIGLQVTDSGGLSDTDTATVTVNDPTSPIITPSINGTEGNNDWYVSDVTVAWVLDDPESGIASSNGCDTTILNLDTAGVTLTCSAMNGAGLSNSTSVRVKIDKAAPTLTWIGGINDGDSFFFGFVSPAPICTALDNLSGIDGSCDVSGYATTVGLHTLTATAKDYAGNEATESRDYTVQPWTLNGFYQPVDMNDIYNVVKNGSTVPFKFEIFAGSNELTDVSNIKSLTYAETACNATATTDEIETTTTGNTSLRYDTTTGQFIYNWKTPKTAGKCYRVTMATADNSSLVAYFKLK